MNNADLIVATLHAAGIRHGFGVPSGNVLPLMEAMRKGGIEWVLTAHEGSAGFAADVTGRMTGTPGLAIATLGPGATNLATGVGSAYLDRSPMIAITCTLNEAQLGRRIQMWIDHHKMFEPITKATFRLERGKVAATLAEAIRIALAEPQGPVHLDLPEDVSLAEATEAVPQLAQQQPLPKAGDDEIAAALARIAHDAGAGHVTDGELMVEPPLAGLGAAEEQPGQPGRPAAAQQGEQHGLRLVVGGVAGERVRSEEFSASRAGSGLEVRSVVELGAGAPECHTEAISDPLGRCGRVVRVVAHAMMNVDRDDIQVGRVSEGDQRRRIGATGERACDGGAGGWEHAAGEEFAREPECVGSQRSWWRRCRLPLGCRLASTLYR